jgi:hypothetical protein
MFGRSFNGFKDFSDILVMNRFQKRSKEFGKSSKKLFYKELMSEL